MEKVDLRVLTAEARKELRRVAVRLYKRGRRKGEIAQELGLRPTTVGQWISRYEQSGVSGLNEGERGRPLGNGRTLSPAQEERIRRDIIDRTPDQLKMPFALWNAQAVRALMLRHFGIQMPARTVRKYLARWGFTPQRPLKRAYEQKPALVKQWLDESYPAIKARAQAEGAEISWGDETAVSSVEHYPRGYAPKGKTPVLVLSQAKRERLNVLSALCTWQESDASPPTIVTSARALMQRTLPRREYKLGVRTLRVGQRIMLTRLLSTWLDLGYAATSVVEEPGTFSRRGGILDIYSADARHPVRIELFGDQVDSMRVFDPATQRSLYQVEDWVNTFGDTYGDNGSYAYEITKRMTEGLNETSETMAEALQWCRENFGTNMGPPEAPGRSSWHNCVVFNFYGDPTTTVGRVMPNLRGDYFNVATQPLRPGDTTDIEYRIENVGNGVSRRSAFAVHLSPAMRSSTPTSASFAPWNTGVSARNPRIWAHHPRWVSRICPTFMRLGTPSGLSTMSTASPSGRYGMSSSGTIRAMIPLLP